MVDSGDGIVATAREARRTAAGFFAVDSGDGANLWSEKANLRPWCVIAELRITRAGGLKPAAGSSLPHSGLYANGRVLRKAEIGLIQFETRTVIVFEAGVLVFFSQEAVADR